MLKSLLSRYKYCVCQKETIHSGWTKTERSLWQIDFSRSRLIGLKLMWNDLDVNLVGGECAQCPCQTAVDVGSSTRVKRPTFNFERWRAGKWRVTVDTGRGLIAELTSVGFRPRVIHFHYNPVTNGGERLGWVLWEWNVLKHVTEVVLATVPFSVFKRIYLCSLCN